MKETESALLVESDEIDEGKAWVPLSQVEDGSDVQAAGDEGDLVISEWLALKKGWL